MVSEEQARRDLVEISRRIHARGWVANHDGNASVRVAAGRIVATPTAVSKGEVAPELLIVVCEAGKRLEGTRNPFSELTLHLLAYKGRPDVHAVLHAHPPSATAFAVSGASLDPAFMPEAVVSLGASIPTCEFALPFGEAGAAPLAPHLPYVDAVLLAGHGVLTWGPDLWTAYYRMELVEHLARIKLASLPLGGPRPLRDDELAPLLDRRRKAGLGPEARGVSETPEPAPSAEPAAPLVGPCAGPIPTEVEALRPMPTPSPAEIEALVAAEIARVLRRQA